MVEISALRNFDRKPSCAISRATVAAPAPRGNKLGYPEAWTAFMPAVVQRYQTRVGRLLAASSKASFTVLLGNTRFQQEIERLKKLRTTNAVGYAAFLAHFLQDIDALQAEFAAEAGQTVGFLESLLLSFLAGTTPDAFAAVLGVPGGTPAAVAGIALSALFTTQSEWRNFSAERKVIASMAVLRKRTLDALAASNGDCGCHPRMAVGHVGVRKGVKAAEATRRMIRFLRCVIMAVAVVAGGVLASAVLAQTDDGQVIRDTFIAGTTGNAVTFRVLNSTNERITGVRMTPSFPLQWIALTGIKPDGIAMEPGEIAEFEIEFLIYDDAPDGASEAVTLFFTANEDIEVQNPQFNLVIDIVRGVSDVHFVVSIEGQGFVPAFDRDAKPRTVDADGTVWIGQSGATVGWEVAGSHEMWMTLKVGEDHDLAKEHLRNYLLSRICRSAEGGANSSSTNDSPASWEPVVWQRGPKVVTVAGPFASQGEYGAGLKQNWKGVRKKRPDGSFVLMTDLTDKATAMNDCGGSCCDVKCDDPFHCN